MREEDEMKTKKLATLNREAWLRAVYAEIRRTLLPEAPVEVALTWGFPVRGATRQRNRTIGECWSGPGAAQVEGKRAIMISPVIQSALQVADVLVHEMVHAALPPEVGHQGKFVAMMKRVGLIGKPTATVAGPELKAKLESIIAKVGPWPAGHLVPPAPKDKSRQLKCECDCGRILRVSRKVYEGGRILCGECDTQFLLEGEERPEPKTAVLTEAAKVLKAMADVAMDSTGGAFGCMDEVAVDGVPRAEVKRIASDLQRGGFLKLHAPMRVNDEGPKIQQYTLTEKGWGLTPYPAYKG